jgi:putative thioredoxin
LADFLSKASLAGAVDLSSLRKPAAANPNTDTQGQATSGAAPTVLKVPDLTALGTESNIKNFVTISQSVPVLIDFFADDLAESKSLSEKLKNIVTALGGKVFLLRIDTVTQTQIIQAFGVTEVPTTLAMLKGQPIPLFQGDQPEAAIQELIAKLLQVAAENGVTATLELSADFPTPAPEPQLSAKHQAAFDAMESGNFEAAVSAYQAVLLESPADKLAVAGLAQAKLLVRTKDIDIDAVLASEPNTVEQAKLKADAQVAIGQTAPGYKTILDMFAISDKDQREDLRRHLLELFDLAQPDAPELANARRALAALLY